MRERLTSSVILLASLVVPALAWGQTPAAAAGGGRAGVASLAGRSAGEVGQGRAHRDAGRPGLGRHVGGSGDDLAPSRRERRLRQVLAPGGELDPLDHTRTPAPSPARAGSSCRRPAT